mmetsp:Transcript_29954/g.27418  ORF Transcript_29954/g.27418 Transcript_29954/m.27418 type:complete len:91 (-) Transcript_29954:625-897(-)|eukprot:CAMPEP_0114591416 /NCGR_PEP_ID=MMETSP0125-20121206/13463_1 /TAXON_ID=485358 ORGANISM="Aristerostoma sp., Strain ATCC 50986" /NCGR_SAMPLE_ID=MMETSP0125 /ASSEMBLY_ACC=CAM_ASM_000245 /LENGTH=90 /DNA_ID=CAMNT_0001789479 /DNA_START=564 /DNA_END=836 /DNA_ORIENTATION=+
MRGFVRNIKEDLNENQLLTDSNASGLSKQEILAEHFKNIQENINKKPQLNEFLINKDKVVENLLEKCDEYFGDVTTIDDEIIDLAVGGPA